MPGPQHFVDQRLHLVARIIVYHPQFLEDDMPLLLDGIRLIQRVAKEVEQQRKAVLKVRLCNLAPINRQFMLGSSVYHATHAFYRSAYLLRFRTLRRPLEHHVLKKVRQPRLFVRLIPRANSHEHAHTHRPCMRHLARHHPHPIFQRTLLEHTILSLASSSMVEG